MTTRYMYPPSDPSLSTILDHWILSPLLLPFISLPHPECLEYQVSDASFDSGMDHQESGNRVLDTNPELGSTAQSVGETRISIEVDEKDENSVRRGDDEEGFSCGVDVNCGEDLERVCRICHLNAKDMNSKDLIIEIGCNCKGELGFAHLHCAEAWFKLKGNRLCEICGETVKNVRGVGNVRFMEEWNDGGASAAESGKSCWNGQPFCNFLMACLVITLLLPWFLRVDIF